MCCPILLIKRFFSKRTRFIYMPISTFRPPISTSRRITEEILTIIMDAILSTIFLSQPIIGWRRTCCTFLSFNILCKIISSSTFWWTFSTYSTAASSSIFSILVGTSPIPTSTIFSSTSTTT